MLPAGSLRVLAYTVRAAIRWNRMALARPPLSAAGFAAAPSSWGIGLVVHRLCPHPDGRSSLVFEISRRTLDSSCDWLCSRSPDTFGVAAARALRELPENREAGSTDGAKWRLRDLGPSLKTCPVLHASVTPVDFGPPWRRSFARARSDEVGASTARDKG